MLPDHYDVTQHRSVLTLPGVIRIHTCPKNASSSINEAVYGLGFSHDLPTVEGNEFRFMVVRHPADRIVSAWSYFSGLENGLSTLGNLGYYSGMGFVDFMNRCLEIHDKNQHTRKQIVFAGPHYINWVCTIENLNNGWRKLRERFPILPALGHKHRTAHKDWRDYFTIPQLSKIVKVFQEDIELYERRRP